MKKYIVYNSNGQIIKTGSCADSDFERQGEFVMEGTADDSSQYIENGQIVDMPPRPSDSHFFDYTNKSWKFNQGYAESIIRGKRDHLLSLSDWTQMPDVSMSDEVREQWKVYRQALRDITQQPLDQLKWPDEPGV
jgi:hypothetical protein